MKWWLILLGIMIGLYPIFMAFIVSLQNGVSIFNEGTGGGAYLFFLPFTLLIGLVLSIIGIFV